MTGPRFLGLRGTITLRIIGACPEEFLMRLVNFGVRFRNYRKEDELTAYLVIPAEKLSTARAAAKKINSYFKGLFGNLDRNLSCYASEVAVNQSLFTFGRSIYGIYSYRSLLVCRLNSGSCAQS